MANNTETITAIKSQAFISKTDLTALWLLGLGGTVWLLSFVTIGCVFVAKVHLHVSNDAGKKFCLEHLKCGPRIAQEEHEEDARQNKHLQQTPPNCTTRSQVHCANTPQCTFTETGRI